MARKDSPASRSKRLPAFQYSSRFILALALGLWPIFVPTSGALATAPCDPAFGTSIDGETTYRTVSFRQVGICEWLVPAGVSEVNLLVVGGGGGGGKSGLFVGYGGGGGGGQVTTTTLRDINSEILTIGVGQGGGASSDGGSSFVSEVSSTTTALGGRAGKDDNPFSGAGGSSGSGNGGGTPNGDWSAGGGGGETSAGGNASGNTGGAGGAGLSVSFRGISGDFGGGGGGGGFGTRGAEGLGGGGSGGNPGVSNSGGGGGGATTQNASGRVGGSGIVVASYALLVPDLALVESTPDGFIVAISNYTTSDLWTVSATAGTASIDTSTGRVTVTGLAPGQGATITVAVDQDSSDPLDGLSATLSAAALSEALSPTFALPIADANGFRVAITNYDASFTWTPTTTAGTVAIDGSRRELVVTGLRPLQSATITLTTQKIGHVAGSATVSSQALGQPFLPQYSSPIARENGFTITPTEFDPLFTVTLERTDSKLTLDPKTGVVTATGLADGEEVTATIVTRRVGYVEGRVTAVGKSLLAPLNPQLGPVTSTDNGFTFRVTNYDSSFTWRVTSSAGQASISSSGEVTVGRLSDGDSARVVIQTLRQDSRPGFASITGSATALPATLPSVQDPTVVPPAQETPLTATSDNGTDGEILTNDLGPVLESPFGPLSLVNIFTDRSPIGPILDVTVDLSVGSPISGKAVGVSASRLQPGSEVIVTIYSTPTEVGRARVDEFGTVAFSKSVPGTLPPGIHTLDVRGTGEDGQPTQSAGVFEVDDQGLILRAIDPAQTSTIVEPGGPELQRALAAGAPLYDPTRFPAETAALAVAAAATVAAAGAAARSGGSSGSPPSTEANSDGAELGAVYDEDLAVVEEPREGPGDRSRTWRHRRTASVDRWVAHVGSNTGPWVRLPARLLRESTWSRALFGSGATLLWLVGIVLGVVWGFQTSWLALPPAFGLLAAVVLLGMLDGLAGALAWVVLFSGAIVTGSLTSLADVRTVMGLFVISIALSLIASATRPLRRLFSGESTYFFNRVADYLVSSVVVVVSGSAMYVGLNGMAGLEVVSEDLLPLFQVLLVVGVVSRSLVEDIATHLYPLRTHQLSQVDFPTPGKFPSVLSVLARAAAFVFVASSFLGWDVKLLIIVALFALPPLLMIWYDELPNSEFLFRYLPRGMTYWLVLTLIGIVTAAWILGQINPGGDVITEYAIFFLPWALIDAGFAFGKDGKDWPDGWIKRIIGIAVVGYTAALLMGWVSLFGQ